MEYAFLYARVGNRTDAEDLTQRVAMNAIARLRQILAPEAIRAYRFATARSVPPSLWCARFGSPKIDARDALRLERRGPAQAGQTVRRALTGRPGSTQHLSPAGPARQRSARWK